jgi:hypothetical protein
MRGRIAAAGVHVECSSRAARKRNKSAGAVYSNGRV